jgi:membrane fusion protein (multidrug efflux system)
VPDQQYDEQSTRFLNAQQKEKVTAAHVEVARAALTLIETEAAEIEVLARQIDSLDAQKDVLLARRGKQLIELDDRNIEAAFDGVVDAVFVELGEYVAPGTRLLMYHDPSEVWVDANVKETEFRKLWIGAPATVKVDAYPDREFKGKVIRLGEAATSEFALLPSPNPSGNFTKVTQRLPIRVAIEQDDALLRPGMMVELELDVVK